MYLLHRNYVVKHLNEDAVVLPQWENEKTLVYRLVDEYEKNENIPFENTKYHKSCYKYFKSKHNLSTSVLSVQRLCTTCTNSTDQ